MLIENAQDGLRVMAGMGWRKEAPDFAAALNDALGGLFASGTSEIQLEILARNLMIQSRGQ